MRSFRILRCAAGTAGASGAAASSGNSASTPSASVDSTLHSFRTRDITLRIPSKDHLIRVAFCSTRHLLAETIRRHNLLRLTGANVPFLQLLGTQLTFTNLLASAQEGEERVETRFTTEEATILTEALALGECRCYLRPDYNAQLEERGEPTFPLRVNRILYRQQTPFSSLVHADLAELLQPPTSSDKKEGGVSSSDAHELAGVPFSLYTPGMAARVPLEAWTDFFAHNSTLHAYNYLRRSDGSVPAVWMHAGIDLAALQSGGLVKPDGTPIVTDGAEVEAKPAEATTEEASAAAMAQSVQRALRHAISHSFGVTVTPLAAGDAVDRQVGRLNRVLAEAAALLHSPHTTGGNAVEHRPSPLLPLLQQCSTTHATCQHILSFITGDHDGAHAAAVAARQYSCDPAQVAAVVDPVRRQLGVDDVVVPLEATEAVRTGLDFFCRCSKANIMASLVAAPASALASLKESDGVVNCSFCGKHYRLGAADWAQLDKTRAAPPS